MTKFTHTGTINGRDIRVGEDWSRTASLRQTKAHWIDESGSKYSKQFFGNEVAIRTFSVSRKGLDLASIKTA